MQSKSEDTKTRFKMLMNFLAKQCNREVDPLLMSLYAQKLSQYGFERVNKGLERLAMSVRQFPTIAEIKKEMGIEVPDAKTLSFVLAQRLFDARRKFGTIKIRDRRQEVIEYVGDPKLKCFTSDQGFFALYQSIGETDGSSFSINQCAANISYRVSKLDQEVVEEIYDNIQRLEADQKEQSNALKEQVEKLKETFAVDPNFVSKIKNTDEENLATIAEEKTPKINLLTNFKSELINVKSENT